MRYLLGLVSAGAMAVLAMFTMGGGSGPGLTEPITLPLALGAIHPRISPTGGYIALSYQGAIWRVSIGQGDLIR